MVSPTRRGYQIKDEQQFTNEQLLLLQKAAEEVQYLLDHGYGVKQITTFVGNHYMFSERQRLALSRCLSLSKDLVSRKEREEELNELLGSEVYLDGFNTIITLEVAFSGSMVLECRDGCIRDLAGLRGTYRIIEVTSVVIKCILDTLQKAGVKKAIWYLDAPVSNSGRLKGLILELAEQVTFDVEVEVLNEVDQILEGCSHVVTSDAIILNRCNSWVNLTRTILEEHAQNIWKIRL